MSQKGFNRKLTEISFFIVIKRAYRFYRFYAVVLMTESVRIIDFFCALLRPI
jgi:hypothetical protein